MAYEVILSEEADHDLELIFDHLVETYLTFGESLQDAFGRAEKRVAAVKSDMKSLSLAPYQGTLQSDLRSNLRHVTKRQAIFYFEIDEEHLAVQVLAVFYGGQDHQRHMTARLRTI